MGRRIFLWNNFADVSKLRWKVYTSCCGNRFICYQGWTPAESSGKKIPHPPHPSFLLPLYRLYFRFIETRLERLSRQGGGTPPTTTPPILAHVLKARPPKKECMRATKTRPDLRLTMMVIVTIFSIRWKHKKGKQTILISRWDCLFHFCMIPLILIIISESTKKYTHAHTTPLTGFGLSLSTLEARHPRDYCLLKLVKFKCEYTFYCHRWERLRSWLHKPGWLALPR